MAVVFVFRDVTRATMHDQSGRCHVPFLTPQTGRGRRPFAPRRAGIEALYDTGTKYTSVGLNLLLRKNLASTC